MPGVLGSRSAFSSQHPPSYEQKHNCEKMYIKPVLISLIAERIYTKWFIICKNKIHIFLTLCSQDKNGSFSPGIDFVSLSKLHWGELDPNCVRNRVVLLIKEKVCSL